MRCKLHPYANALGVCAPCLRDRLLVLAAERDRAGASSGASSSSSRGSSPTRGRSASPHGASAAPQQQHRRSDACAYASSRHHGHRPELLFFSTPQVGPCTRATDDEPRGTERERKKPAHLRRSFLAALFGGGRRRGRQQEANGEGSSMKEDDPPRRSTSWLSAIVRRKRRPLDAASTSSLPRPIDEEPGSPGGSTSWWLPSPSPARHHHRQQRRGRPGGSGASGDGISGFAVCLSPLVRPSSGGRRRCQPQQDPSSQDASHRRHVSAGGAASFGRNTSRKLADMGRFR